MDNKRVPQGHAELRSMPDRQGMVAVDKGRRGSQAKKLWKEGCKVDGLLVESGQDALSYPLKRDCAQSRSPVALWACIEQLTDFGHVHVLLCM